MTDFANLAEMVAENTFVTTRDGIQLHTVIVKPKKEGRFPVILCRGPYNLPYDTPVTAENYSILNFIIDAGHNSRNFINAGYCFVYQHCRGTGNSSGTLYLGMHDFADVCDTLDWIRTQDFYNGEIYRYGGSYLAMTSLIDAQMHYKDIKGIIAAVPVPLHVQLANRNGFLKTGIVGPWQTVQDTYYGQKKINFTPDTFRTFPQKDWSELIFGEQKPLYVSSQLHPDENDPYWRSLEAPMHEYYASLEQLDVPTLFITGWFDLFVDPTIKYWNNTLPEETRKKSALLISPYGHMWDGNSKTWQFKMAGATSNEVFPNWAVNWFNHIRSGEALENIKENAITFFPECGQKKWYFEQGKFKKGENAHTLFLNEDRKLDAVQGNISETTYLYNPYNPACFYGGVDQHPGFPRPGFEDMPLDANQLVPQDPPNWRYDVISFEAKPFEQQMFIKGAMSADLYVKSDCEDTCFYIRVHLVKNGVTYGIREDITSICNQHGDYTPGEEVKLHFEFGHLVWNIQPGDQLRIDVTSSCFPLYSLHTNVKGLQAAIDKPKYAHNTVVFGKSSFTYPTSALSADEYGMVEVENRED